MPRPRHLGNDIVALTAPRCRGKADDPRFLDRVFSSEEREAIAASVAPESSLWLHWAGKEAIYKSATKMLGAPPVFHHDRFQISFSGDPIPNRKTSAMILGTGSYEALSFRIQADLQPDYIHALAWASFLGREGYEDGTVEWQALRPEEETEVAEEELRRSFSPQEWDCVSHRSSALTRLRARRALATALGLDEKRVEVRCGPGAPGRRVPLVFLDGREIPLDLTLSHDAQLMAWAFVRPPDPPHLSGPIRA